MSLPALAERWIDTRNTAKPSPNTAAARRGDLATIAELLQPEASDDGGERLAAAMDGLEVADPERRRLEDAFAAFAKKRSPSSTRGAMSTWRQFCLWLVREHELDRNPMDLIDAPKRGSWQPKPLQAEDLEAIAAVIPQPDTSARTGWPMRDRALFALFITAGLRASEVIGLEVGDAYLDADPPRLRVVGKGSKPRTVTIPPETVATLRLYLDERHDQLGTPAPGERLIVRTDGRPCTRSVIDNIVRRWFRRAGRTPPKGALAHSLRRTYATLLIENGASLPEVQRLLGHADLSTTQAYLGVTGKGLEEAALANPARHLLEP